MTALSLSSRRRLEFVLVAILALTMALLLWLERPSQTAGPDWWTFSQLGPMARDLQYWLLPEAFNGNYWSVGYSGFVGVFLASQESSIATLMVVQGLMAVSMALMVYGFTFRFGFGIRIAALLTASISPSLYWMAWNGGYEILLSWLICIALLGIWMQTSELQKASPLIRSTVMTFSGFSLGLASIVASKTIFMLIFVIVFIIFRRYERAHAFIIGASIPVGLWSLRNLFVTGSPSPLNRNGPVNLWIGNNPDATNGGYMDVPLPEGIESHVEATVNSIIAAPEFTVGLTLRKVARLLEPVYIYPDSWLMTPVLIGLHFFTACLGVGLLMLFVLYISGRAWTRPPVLPPIGLLAFAYVCFFVLHIPFLAESRFRAPLEPILISVSIPTLFFLIRRLKRASAGGAGYSC